MKFLWLLCLGLWPLTSLLAQSEASVPTYAAARLIMARTFSETGGSYLAAGSDTSAVAALSGAVVTLQAAVVSTSGWSSNQQASGRWGVNSAVLAAGTSYLTLVAGSIKTQGRGAPALASTGASVVDALATNLTTFEDASPGLLATGGGTLRASGVSVLTGGNRSPLLAVGEGGGTLIVTGGTMNSRGEDSPGLWSEGDLQVTGAILTATHSEAAVVAGPHTLSIVDTVLVASKGRGLGLTRGTWAADSLGSASFSMTGGSLTALEGPLVEAQGVRGSVLFRRVLLVGQDGLLVRSLSSELSLQADNQDLRGDLEVDDASSLILTLKNGSTWTGAADTAQLAKGLSLALESGSLWTVSADSRVSSLRVEGATASTVARSVVSGGHTIWYKASVNGWLGGQTVALPDGGTLRPY